MMSRTKGKNLTEARSEIKGKEKLPTGNESVLFVDDEPAMTQIYKSTLEHLGCIASIRTSSIEALEAKRTQTNMIWLSPIRPMPHLTGQMMARQMMAIRPDIPVILCTDHSDLINDDMAKEMGIQAFLMKPIAMGGIARTIREVLERRTGQTGLRTEDWKSRTEDRKRRAED